MFLVSKIIINTTKVQKILKSSMNIWHFNSILILLQCQKTLVRQKKPPILVAIIFASNFKEITITAPRGWVVRLMRKQPKASAE